MLAMIFGAALCAALGLSIAYASADSQTQSSGTSSQIQQPPSYIIYIVGTTIFAQKGIGGDIPFIGPDAATVINNAASSLTNGGVILIEDGSYNITSTIKLHRDNVALRGQSWSTILKPAQNVDGITVTGNDDVINSLNISHVTTGTGNNIKINNNVNRLDISNNLLDNGYHAIDYSGANSNDIKIINNKIVNAGRADGAILIINGGTSAQVNHVEISNNFIVNAQFHGIQVYDAINPLINDVKIINNIIDTPAKAGIFVSRVNGTLIQGNTILNAKYESLDAEASSNVTFDANYVQNGTLQGISTFPVNGVGNTNVVVTNNIINTNKGPTSEGIYIDTADGVEISGNKVSVYTDGISITHDLSDVSITGNNVTAIGSSGYGIRVDLGTNKTVNKVLIDGNIVKGFYGNIAVISGKVTDLVVKNNDVLTYGNVPMTLSGAVIINKMINNDQPQVNTPTLPSPLGLNTSTPKQPTTGLEENQSQLVISQQQPTQINIHGTVNNPRGGTVYLHITKPDGSIDLNWAYILSNGTFSSPMLFDRHSTTGQYKINVVYQNSNLGSLLLNVTADHVPLNETYAHSNIGTSQSQSDAILLTQIKSDAKLWSQDQISDDFFGNSIQYLVKAGIIPKPNESQMPLLQSTQIPSWFKNNAGWWADGQISDSDFISGVQYLLNSRIIRTTLQ